MENDALERPRTAPQFRREAQDFRPTPSRLCGWCAHQSLCPEFGGTPPPLPDRVGEAVRDGIRLEVRPVSRQLAEVRGLANQTIRRLERIETELLAERNSRVDDLGLMVDLVESSWRAVDERLRRIEEAVHDRRGATVYRIGEAG
jgi:hypothetical protein